MEANAKRKKKQIKIQQQKKNQLNKVVHILLLSIKMSIKNERRTEDECIERYLVFICLGIALAYAQSLQMKMKRALN